MSTAAPEDSGSSALAAAAVSITDADMAGDSDMKPDCSSGSGGGPRHRDPSAQPKRSILRRNSSDSDLADYPYARRPVFLSKNNGSCPYGVTAGEIIPMFRNMKVTPNLSSSSSKRRPSSASGSSLSALNAQIKAARSPARVVALLKRHYGPDTLLQIPPQFVSTGYGTSMLREPYDETLKKARAKSIKMDLSGERRRDRESSPESTLADSPDDVVDRGKRETKITWGEVRICD